jgi:glycine C-acetyltransferase
MNVMLLIGATGKGTLEAKGVMGRVDIITGTLESLGRSHGWIYHC